jgi:hypothetical protein
VLGGAHFQKRADWGERNRKDDFYYFVVRCGVVKG